MINQIEVIVPYSRKSNIKKGDTYQLNSQNILLKGGNGVGKSSLLHMIFESLKINRDKNENRALKVNSFSVHALEEGPISIENSRNYNIPGILTEKRILYEMLRNSEQIGLKAKKNILEVNLGKIHRGTMPEFEVEEEISYEVDTLETIAKEGNIDREFVFGTAIQLLDQNRREYSREQFPIIGIDTSLTIYFYSVVEGENLDEALILASYTYPGEKILRNSILSGSNISALEMDPGSTGESRRNELEQYLNQIF